jgi:hypothetical protein
MKRLFIILVLSTGILPLMRAQEIITELSENPVIKEYRAEHRQYQSELGSGREERSSAVRLPFFDDFKNKSIYPDPELWDDSVVFINSSYAYRAPNRGVATFDALDNKGNLHFNVSTFPFRSDSLTSKPIRLDSIFSPFQRAITTADSLYLSFFYQPQGIGNKPESFDSLVLEFGYDTTVYAGYLDSVIVDVADLNIIGPGDSIVMGDTVFAPGIVCDPGLYVIADTTYYYDDEIILPCDSVFEEETAWTWKWSAEGMSISDFYDSNLVYFKQVLIPITDSARYYRDGFRFRFRNIASLADDFNPSWRSNSDHWNIDYVYLNINRNQNDIYYRDISFAERAPSMLRDYQAMPYNQYINDPTNEIKDSLGMSITNLDNTLFNYQYLYKIVDEEGLYPYTYDGGFCNLEPYSTSGYQNCVICGQHACPPVNYVFSLDLGEMTSFTITHILLGDITAFDTISDTTIFRQQFRNYYAYDDGTPEAGYGLTPAGAQLAYKFELNVRDTLRAVQMYFNRVQDNSNQQFFNLRIWGDNNGIPGDLIYEQLNEFVEYSNSLTQFHTYLLDEPLPVNGIFYIGWEQTTTDNLNLGLDKNTNSKNKIFFNADGQWLASSIPGGSLMMRPVLGREEFLGMEGHPKRSPLTFKVYPNPLRGNQLHLELPSSENKPENFHNLRIDIYNALGQQVSSRNYSNPLPIAASEKGLYIVRLINTRTLKKYSSRLIITR